MAARAPAARVGALAGAAGATIAALLALAVIGALGGVALDVSGSSQRGAQVYGASGLAVREIPPQYLRLYQQAAGRYGLDWAILAGIGRVECDHGRDPDT